MKHKDAYPTEFAHVIIRVGFIGLCLFVTACLIAVGQRPIPPIPRPVLQVNPGQYLTHVSTDKPIYRGGERVYVRGVVLSANDHAPGATGVASFEIKGPKGDTVASGVSTVIDSVIGFAWDIPAGQAGGEYTVRILHPGDAPGERRFDIRTYRAPRLKSQIVFVRDGYGPGDTVSANLHVERAEGGIPAVARISTIARVDGEEVWKGETRLDVGGNASATFKLPSSIARGEGSLAMIIEDGGTVETATKTIPILLQTLDVSIYPEGGDLVAGLPNRVYVEGRTPAQKPADMAGIIVNRAGREVAKFRTEHEGRGRFSFVPAKGETYSLRIKEPAGIQATFPLPMVKDSGVVLASPADITPKQKDVTLRLAATTEGEYGIALAQRGQELAFKAVLLKAGQTTDVTLSLPENVEGVMTATVFGDGSTPLAERLLFRQPQHNLKIRVVADRNDYVPGDRVTLRITTTDDAGKPVGAVVGLTVTDSSVLEMIDKREQTGQLPVMVLLENDVKNLSDAQIYLDETNSKAPLATDLLLGTQGWRRFAAFDLQKFIATYGDSARRTMSGIRMTQQRIGGSTAAILGTVQDPSRALIPGVTIAAMNVDSGIVAATMTDESGAYNLSGLVPGTYTVSASLPGFQTKKISGAQLREGFSSRYNIDLAVANVNTAVEVTVADAVLPMMQIRDLPMVGNNVLDFREVKEELRKDLPFAAASPPPVMQPALMRDEKLMDGFAGRLAEKADVARRQAAAYAIVREYAHTRLPGWNEQSRVDFAETVYWNAGVKTNASTGVATVAFNLSDSVTSFRVLADAFSQDGRLASSVSHVESVRPFFIEPKMPLQITSGDVIQLPITFVNGLSTNLRGIELHPKMPAGLHFANSGGSASVLNAKERIRRLLRVEAGSDFSGTADFVLDARAGLYRDTVSRKLVVRPPGFPFEKSSGGILESNGSTSFEFILPQQMVRGSLSTSVMVYPTPLASMNEALQSLLQEPNGCFEQTSSTSYPMVMAQQYFLTHTGVDPKMIEKARGLLESSYKKLTAFETRSRGYEWFGADPGHEALTAYGLMQFTDMAQVRSVDKEMLDRTRTWLLSRRDGNGGFRRSEKAIDSFGGAPADTTNAYITWALIESGEKGLQPEIAAVKRVANSTQDSYVLALAANILKASGDSVAARQLMDKLGKAQDSTAA
jgi:hypothetical protein